MWTQPSEKAFNTLNKKLVNAPIVTYPKFDCDASAFLVQTDASGISLDTVLEQDSHVIAYAS